MKFKVLDGKHQESVRDEDGAVSFVIYRTGDIVKTDADLCRMFNSKGARKFLRLDDDTPARLTPPKIAKKPEEDPDELAKLKLDIEESEDIYAGLTVAELRTLAEDEEIDLEGVVKKDDILKIMYAHNQH
jgi:hypothetical protein